MDKIAIHTDMVTPVFLLLLVDYIRILKIYV